MGLIDSFRIYLRTGVAARASSLHLQRYSSWETMAPAYAMTNPDRFVVEGFRKNALVYRCVMVLANALSEPRMLGVVNTPEGDAELPPADPLARLLERPSTEHTGPTDFVVHVSQMLLTGGECPLYKVPGERTGRTVELQPLFSSRLEVERKTNGEKVYLYRYDAGRPPRRLRPNQVIFLKFRDPLNRDRGLAPLAAAARETDTDNEITDWRNAFFANGGMPPGILTTEQPASQEQLLEWSVQWRQNYGGKKGASRTPALGGGLSYEPTGAKPGEVDLGNLTGLSESRICQAFGVPPILVGAKVGLDRSTYANYQHARRSFWEETVAPMLTFLADGLTDGLTEHGDRRRVKFDTSTAPALREDASKVEERSRRALEAGAITINEYREAIGKDPVADGDVYYRPGGKQAVKAGNLAKGGDD